jgi:DNA-binding transcriptional LysR family regulator
MRGNVMFDGAVPATWWTQENIRPGPQQDPFQAWHLCSEGMNVQQLRYLVAVSDLGSVSAAARSLHVGQPAISRSIRSFEVEHGVTVFRLSGRRLVPTEAGTTVVDAARHALDAIDAVEQEARSAGGQAEQELVIATTPTNGLLLTSALSELAREETDLEIKVQRAGEHDEVLRMVEDRRAEIGFRELHPGVDLELVSKPLAEMDIVLVSPKGSDLPAAVTWDDVVRQPLILPPAGSGRRQLIDDQITRLARNAPQAALTLEDRGSWVAAAQAGMGSFLCYRCLVAGIEDLEVRSFDPPTLVTVGFVHRARPISRPAERLIEIALKSVGQPSVT